jgi:undecaprenyl diphosphate synthase
MAEKIPIHVSIIPDGNRRWAKSKGMIASIGHRKAGSREHMKELLDEGKRLGLKYMSFWGFSTENWKRSKKEIDTLFDIILENLDFFRSECEEGKIRFRVIGRRDRMPKRIVDELERLEKETESYDKMDVQLCLDYGGRDEIVRAVNKAVKDGKEVDEESFKEFLDTKDIPDADLIIRTSGEKRLSGLMAYQGTYAELYFVDIHFPDFGPEELKKAVEDFSKRKRTFGGN